MTRVVWSPPALEDREAIWAHIAADDAKAAARVDSDLRRAVSALADFPELGRPGVVRGTREIFPIRTYRVVYEVVAGEVRFWL